MRREIRIVAQHYQVSEVDIMGKSRKGNLPEARKMICYLLRNKYHKKEIAKQLNLTFKYVYVAIIDMRFFINTYAQLKQRAMSIENTLQLERQAIQIEGWLRENYEEAPHLVFEKQKELETINQKLKSCQQ